MSRCHMRMVATAEPIANVDDCAPAQYRVLCGGKTLEFATLDECLQFRPPARTSAAIQIDGRAAYHWSEAHGIGGYVLLPRLRKCGA